MTGPQVVVFAGGDAPVPEWRSVLTGPVIWRVAADSGLDHALAVGERPDLVVGDLDSVSPRGLARARDLDVDIEAYPADKDRTDLALAMDRAHTQAAAEGAGIVVVGGHGGRLDHLLGNVALLAAPEWADVPVTAVMGAALVTVIRERADVHGHPGSIVSLVPVHGAALGVTTTGLRWVLTDATLAAGTTWAMSNELATDRATVEVREGVLVAVQPDLVQGQPRAV